ncbi:MAG: phytanoyl-CoA dioxygenase family protein [Planctomycetes bacterium]|nr:phytanoyl-CoA dioxygenase family protein [Planctomycetota bacterium]
MLSPEQVNQYRRDGYTLAPGFLTSGEVSAFLRKMEEISAGNTLANHDKTRMEMEPHQPPDGTRVRRLYEPCTYYPEFQRFSESPKLLDCLEQLLGPNIFFYYSKINMKPGEIGSVVDWHQDLSYYPLTNRDSLAILFYLDDGDRTNGCLMVIPGWHKGRLLDHTREGFFQGRITEPVNESLARPVEGPAGSAIFMNAMTPHASAPNRSARPRRTLILSYRAADAFPIYTGEMTGTNESRVRLMRGKRLASARFSMTEFPIPVYERKIASLYDLQERSRAGEQG